MADEIIHALKSKHHEPLRSKTIIVTACGMKSEKPMILLGWTPNHLAASPEFFHNVTCKTCRNSKFFKRATDSWYDIEQTIKKQHGNPTNR